MERLINDGPSAAGYAGAWGRTPMIQPLIDEPCGVWSSVHSLSQLLKNRGFAYQKARLVSAHQDPARRHAWLTHTGCDVRHVAKAPDAYRRFGAEAAFPQGGTWTYTGATRGPPPTVPTAGRRKGDKVVGVVDYFSGRFVSQGHARRFTAERSAPFLASVLKQTTQPIVLMQDGARYPTRKAMQACFAKPATRLTVSQLPSYAPADNPIEKLWKKITPDGPHLYDFPPFAALVTTGHAILPMVEHAPEEGLSLVGFDQALDNALIEAA